MDDLVKGSFSTSSGVPPVLAILMRLAPEFRAYPKGQLEETASGSGSHKEMAC